MLAKQILKDQQGIPMGIFIPMQIWENLLYQYPDLEGFDSEIPQWEKDFIDERLKIAQHHSERIHPIEMLFESL